MDEVTNPIPEQQLPPLLEEPKPWYQSSDKIWITLGVVIVVAAIGGYFLLKQKPELSTPVQQSQVVDETADWKTYRSEKFGFELKYPADWWVTEVPGGIALSEKKISDFKEGEKILTLSFGSHIVYESYKRRNSIEEVAEEIKNSEKWQQSGFDCNLLKVLGRKAVDCFREISTGNDRQIYFLDDNGDEFSIHDLITNNVSEKILSTFKFIESTGKTCGFYTYNAERKEHCATCGNNICEPFESCTSSNCTDEMCTDDCGPLYCPGDCENSSTQGLPIEDNACTLNQDCILIATECATRCYLSSVNRQFKEKYELDCTDYKGAVSAIPCQEFQAICENDVCTTKLKIIDNIQKDNKEYSCRVPCSGAPPPPKLEQDCYALLTQEQCITYTSTAFSSYRCEWLPTDYLCLLP